MDLTNYMIAGKSVDVTQVAQFLSVGDREQARFVLGLMTGLSGDELEFCLDHIQSLPAVGAAGFSKFPIGGDFYNVEPVMDLLSSGDAMGAYSALRGMGIDDEACKDTIPALMEHLGEYKQSKGEKLQEQEAREEFEIEKQRNLDQNWFAPAKCPQCGAIKEWQPAGQTKGGFSGGKAVAGAVLLGPIGLAAGALGEKQLSFQCGKCGFTQAYSKGSQQFSSLKEKYL